MRTLDGFQMTFWRELIELVKWPEKKEQETTQEETTDGRKHGGGCGVDFELEKSTWHLLQ